jgi:hypothetical protein
MPRPRRLEKQVYFIKLWLLPSRDGDVIRYLENAPTGQRAAAVLRAMRGGLANQPQPHGEAEELESILDHLGELWT